MNLQLDAGFARGYFRRRVTTAGVLAALALSIHVAAPSTAASEAAPIVREDCVDQICSLLRSIPEWPYFADPGSEESDALVTSEAERLESIMEKISAFHTDSLREAVVRYNQEIHSRRSRAVEEHLILLNRFLFNLPERVPRSSPHFAMLCQGGNLGGRKKVVADAQLFGFDSDELPARWPWYEDFDGRWRFWLTRGMNGALITYGPPYSAVEVFDYCLREFGRRNVDVESSVAE